MPSKQHPGQIDRHSRLRRGRVPMRQPASTKAFVACKSLQSVKSIIDFLGLSYSEVGSEYGRLTNSKPISKQAVYKMTQAPRVNDGMLFTLGTLISNRLTLLCGVEVGINIGQNSPLHVTPYLRCTTCHDRFAVDRPGVRHCPDCRK